MEEDNYVHDLNCTCPSCTEQDIASWPWTHRDDPESLEDEE